MSRTFIAACGLALISFISLSSLAQAPPSADAYVTTSQPSINFGSSISLPVQSGTTSFVRLNLGALPANSSIAKATLRLYVMSMPSLRRVRLMSIGSIAAGVNGA